MKRSLMKYFAWISLALLALVSCRSAKILSSGEQAVMIRDSISSGSFNKITLKAKVIFQERELAGLMLIKKTPDGNYKIAFYNEIGLTYLEGTLDTSTKQKKLIVKNIAPIIDHEFFVKSFEKSLQTIFSDKPKPIAQSTNPSSFPASPLEENRESPLIIQLRNGFILELSPQVNQMNTE
jgi:hypothetical protein